MSTSTNSRFITFEGIDGCGKSTQAKLLIATLEQRGKNVVFVREPGGTDISEKVRDILLHSGGDELNERTEALLMTASRAQLTKEVIIPALESNRWVIADRFSDSTLAYQGGGRNLDLEWLIRLNDFATFSLKPHLTFYIDVTPEVGMRRQNKNLDRIERVGLNFQLQVREMYNNLCQRFSSRYVRVDGSLTIEEVQRVILGELKNRNFI